MQKFFATSLIAISQLVVITSYFSDKIFFLKKEGDTGKKIWGKLRFNSFILPVACGYYLMAFKSHTR